MREIGRTYLSLARRGRLSAFVLAASLGSMIVAAGPVDAQNVPEPQRQALEAAFQDLLQDPTNLDKTYEYAKLATSAGDYEAAITSYERLLLFNPDLPRVRAELGVLYYRLGSFETARSYFESALSYEKIPPEVETRIQTFLAKIDDTRTPHRFAGGFTLAGRYQTNANFGPDGNILVNGAPATPGVDTAEDDDFNIFAVLTGRYTYDLGNDAGDFFAVEGSIYGSRQFKFTNLDIEHFRIIAGPGLRYFPAGSGPVTVRPNIRATYVRLDDQSFNFSIGAGMDIDWQALDNMTLYAKGFAEDREYENSKASVNAETQDGGAYRATVGARYLADPNTSIKAEFFAGRVHASEAFEAYGEAGGSISVSTRFDSPLRGEEGLSFLAQPWNATVGVQYARRNRNEANPIVSPDKRSDKDFRMTGTIAVPVASGWTVFTTLGWQDHQSNLPNNEFENFSATLGANVRF